jgi:replicative DNA helicase
LVNRDRVGAPEYAAIVYGYSIDRQVINEAMAITQMAFQNGRAGEWLVNEAIDRLSAIDATRNVSNGPKSIAKGVNALLDRIYQIEQSGQVAGLRTGIKTLDYYLGGLQKKQLYLLAGRPGMGKSALALQIALNLAEAQKSSLYFSLEMSDEKLSERLVSNVSNVPYDAFGRPGLGEQQMLDILAAAEHVQHLPITIDDTPGLTVQSL